MPTLEWIEKVKSSTTIRRCPSGCWNGNTALMRGQHAADNGSENMIIHGGQPGSPQGTAAPV